MRGDTENRAEKYIRNHRNFKRWIAFALCLSLLTGTVTLYMLNKPATAMTEEGAGQVGLVLETANTEFEQGLIEQMNSDDGEEENESTEATSCEDEEVTEPESGSKEATLDSSDVSDVTEENAENEDQSGKSSSSESDDEALNSSSAATLSSNDEESAKNASSASEASSAANSSSDASSAASSGASLAGTASSAASSSASLSGLASSVSSSASSEASEESDEDEIEDVHVTVLYVDNHGEEIAESKELLIEESFDITSEVNELDGYIFNKAFIGDDQIVNIVKKTGKTVTTEKPQKSEEPTDSVAAYISEDEPLEKVVEYTYYEATTSDDKVIEIKEDTDLRLVYFAVNTKEEFVYEGEDVTVTVKLSKPEVLPADVELSVKTVDANTEGYNYAAYMEALNLNSEIIAAASKTEDENTTSEDNEKVLYDETNTILFDVAFMLDSIEYEPKEGSVSVSVKFNNKQISEGLEATEDDDLTVVHLPLVQEVMEEVNSTSEATEITSEDISLEVYKEGSVSLEKDADVLSFETESFSITAVVKNTNNGEHTWEGTNYKSATELIQGLGNAKYFGAVADTVSGNSHFEGNVAVNNYKITTQRVLFDYERTNGGYISSDEYKSYSIVVQKKSTETGTFNFALYRDEAGTDKISGSEFTFNESDFTFSDGYYVASQRIEGFTEKNPNVYAYEIDPESGNPVLDNKSYGNFTVTYESELNETGNAVDALMSSYITNGSFNETKLDEMLYNNATLYFDASSSGWKKGTKDNNNHVTIADELYDIPVDFVDTILDDAKDVSSVLPYICESDTVDTFNIIASQYGDYLSDFYNAGKDKYGWRDQNNLTNPDFGITLDSNKVILINLDLTGRNNYTMGQWCINGKKSDEIYAHFGSIASRIIINPVQKNSAGEYEPYTGNLKLEYTVGTVLAPCASVTNSGAVGSIIADNIQLDGEIHKVTLIGFLKIGGTVVITNTSIKNELELQLYKFVNGLDPQNATFNFTIKRLKDDMTGWSNGKFDSATTDHTALTNTGNSINYKFDPSYWSMVPGNTYIFRITEDALDSSSAYRIDKSVIYAKVVYKGANNAEITYYRHGAEEDTFDYWVNELNKAASKDTSNPDLIRDALVNGICNDSSRIVTGTNVSFNNTTVEGRASISLLKYLNDGDPGDKTFTFTVRVLNSDGKTLTTLTDSLQNIGSKIDYSFEYTTRYVYNDRIYLVITENDINTGSSSDSTLTKDNDYIIAVIGNLKSGSPTVDYFKYDYENEEQKGNIVGIEGNQGVYNYYNYFNNKFTDKHTTANRISDPSEVAFYNTETSMLRIHKIVVNDFGSGFVKKNTGTALLSNVKFRITSQTTGKYIVFQGFTDAEDKADWAIEYDGESHQATGKTYTVTYNNNAQWTIQGIPTDTYTVEEVADGLTFKFDHDENSSDVASSVIETTNLSRVTMYEVTEDEEGTPFHGTGGQNWRKLYAIDLGINDDSYKAPTDVVVGGKTKTVQVCNFYSIPIGPIQVTKNLIGGEWKDLEFTFTMEAVSYNAYDSEGNSVTLQCQPMPGGTTDNSVSVTVSDTSVDADGNKVVKQNEDGTYSAVVKFDSIPFRYKGEYIYKITETGTKLDGINYDSAEYYVKVVVGQKKTTFSKDHTYAKNQHSIYVQNGDRSDHTKDEIFYYLGADVTYSDDKYFNNVLAQCELYLGKNPDTNKPINNTFQVNYTQGDVTDVKFINSLTGKLKVIKNWLDCEGNDDGSNHSVLNLYIWQRPQGSSTWKVYQSKTLTPSEDGKWELIVDNLPLTDENGNKYEYCVKESDEYLATHTVLYKYGQEYNVADQGIITVDGVSCKDTGYYMEATLQDGRYDYGTVVITNKTIFRNALPSTGGAGTMPFATTGATLVIIALIGMLIIQTKTRFKRRRQ